ncbi:hypothetical protein HGA88_00175 [Candidatus Roizmanbacteria bacterium]|nr:hypothetical protein [Candidatus Roizmanbacteria bacterium]
MHPTLKLKPYFSQVESILDLFFVQKIPALPFDWKRGILKYRSLIGVVYAGISTLVYFSSWSVLLVSIVGIIVLFVQLGIYFFALPDLILQQRKGWEKLVFGTVLGTIFYIVSLQFFYVFIVSIPLLYVAFQIRKEFE